MARPRPGRGNALFLLSLGCAKNLVDSEHLAAKLRTWGYRLVESVEDAGTAIVNTCGFIRPATEESIAAILEMERLKAEGRLEKIGVVGCLLNRYGEDLKKELPAVDFWAEAEDWDTLGLFLLKDPGACGGGREPLPGGAKWSRFLKIAEGCGNCCSYCTIPSIRGRLRSLPLGFLATEAQELERQGAREICLVAQDLTAWGNDIYGKPSLPLLLDELEKSVGDETWIRLLYLHPSGIDDKLVEQVLGSRKILRYLDIPIQHADPGILADMNRAITPERLRGIFRRLRDADPDFALRTTVMVGHPGEDEAAFETLAAFVGEIGFDRLGAFEFSPEEGTVSFTLQGKVPARVKKRRLGKLMRIQERISLERQSRFEGRTLKVLVESVDREGDLATGRSYREAPEVDGVIEIVNGGRLVPGTFVSAFVKEALEHDLVAEVQDDAL